MKCIMQLLYAFLFVYISFPGLIQAQVIPKIAIIGGGIGGTSCAFFLKELFQRKVSVSLFEKDKIGGRLRVMDIDDHKYEAGGSVIHPRNQYMVQFSRLLGLNIRKPQSSSKLGIFNGEKFVFEESDWYFLNIAKMIWHYGLSVFHLFKDVRSMLDDFSRIYVLQQKNYAYTSVDLLLDSMNPSFKNISQAILSDVLLKRGYSKKFLTELVQSVMMVNYGQTNNISGFAGFVSLAGAENNLWSIEGGNYLVPEGLLKYSEANLLNANVLEVALLTDETFSVKYHEISENHMKSEKFDIVILATPLIKGNSNIKFVNFKKSFHLFERPYHQTVTTFVKGSLNPLAFNKNSVPDEILTYNNSLLFNSIGQVSFVSNEKNEKDKKVYKVFSQKPLSKKEIEKFFQNVDLVKEKAWLAYPQYKPPEKFVPFILHPGLYYINAIELSASAMEMSVISAKNIALLIFHLLPNTMDKIDPGIIVLKDEL